MVARQPWCAFGCGCFFYGGLKFLHWGRTGVLDRRDIRDNPRYMKLATACGYFSIGFSVFVVCLMFFLK